MPGHLYAVRGRMETLVKDAVVVTTDRAFTLEPHWLPVLGDPDDPAALRPPGWGEDDRLGAPAPGRDGVWFLRVADPDVTLDDLLRGLRTVLEEIARSRLRTSAGRALPLIAVPVPGTGGGGFRERAGAVVAGLLRTVAEVVRQHDVDVVVVATEPAQHAAVQQERRRTQAFPLAPPLLEQARQIGEAAAGGDLALFLGAGVSVPAGLPSWTDLVEELRQVAVARGADLPTDAFATLSVLDRTELLRTVLTDQLEELVAERFRDATPALAHVLLAGLDCTEAVTTNYDDCYEVAAAVQDPETSIAVLPWERPAPGGRWLLKLHGDASRPGSVVLTRDQFLGYDRHWRPVGSLFQGLMMTRQLLVVGASLSDDNVLRLAHEVRELRQRHDIPHPMGHVLALGDAPLRARMWHGELEWLGLGGSGPEDQARRLEIFLDAVAMHASHTSPYLLHPHFADLLGDGTEAELAADARELAARLAQAAGAGRLRQDAAWSGLLAALRAHGAGG